MINEKEVIKLAQGLQPLMKKYGVWMAFAGIPIFANVFLWQTLCVPLHQKLGQLKNTESLLRLKPEVESLLDQSGGLLAAWERNGFSDQNPTGVVKEAQKLAGDHRVQIKQVSMSDSEAPSDSKIGAVENTSSAFTKTSITLEVVGSYNKLARWLSAIESKPGVKISSWSLARSGEGNQTSRLNLNMEVLLKNV